MPLRFALGLVAFGIAAAFAPNCTVLPCQHRLTAGGEPAHGTYEELVKLEGNRILLPITVDPKGENYIEIIPHTAKAGYLTGYADPEFIESLEQISLPFLKSDQKYRAFPIEGDSMPPHADGSFIVGRLLEDINEMKNGKTYILLTVNEEIVYKRVQKKAPEIYTLTSDNTFYEPYDIRYSEVIEVWEFACSIAMKDYNASNISINNPRDVF